MTRPAATNSASKTAITRAIADYLCHLKQRNASPNTVLAYSKDLTIFAGFTGSTPLKEIDHVFIRAFLGHLYERGLSKASVARALAAVRSLFAFLAREGRVTQNPARLVATPKLPKQLPRVPTVEEMNAALDTDFGAEAAFPERDRLIFELLYGCGIRNSELMMLDVGDVLWSNSSLHVRHGKGKKQRYVLFGESACDALTAYLPARERVIAETNRR